tara:strand:- start:24922 stop:28083 length:3162 start_codon:yes stop_codon:yes gene_type:complete
MFKKILFTLSLAAFGFSSQAQSAYYIDQISSTDTVGLLYDQGGASGPYSANTNAVFTITPNNGKQVNIQFRDFDVEPGETSVLPEEFWLCEYDNLTIFDGADTNATSLGTFCGSNLPADMTSTSGSLTFQLKSDGGTEGRGFEIYWTTGELPTLPPPPATAYCIATGYDCDTINGPFDETDVISNVSLTTVNNPSICSANGYADYSHLVAVIAPGTQAQLAVNIDGPGGIPGGVYAWLDTNQDSVFSDEEAIIMLGDVGVEYFTGEPFIGIINAPTEALGAMRLRIRVNGNQAPCGSGDGEVEDYTVFIGDTVVGGGSGYCDGSGPVDCLVEYNNGTVSTFEDDHINYVQLTTDTGNIENITMCDNGYGDFSHIVAPVSVAGNYSIVFTRSNVNDLGTAAGWIDWNNNKIFEESEYYLAANILSDYTINYIVPPTQADGLYRVRLRLGGNQPPLDPCGSNNFEIEDYTLLVGTPLECLSNPMPFDGETDICVSNNTIVWDSVANATNYKFTLIYNDGNGDVIVTQDEILSDTTYTAIGSFVPNATYKWIAVPFNESLEALNCDTLSFSTTANGNPVVDIVETNIEICAGNTYSITANITEGNAPISFAWTDGLGQLNRTDSSVVVFQDNTPGIYTFFVTVSDDLGCPGNTDSVTVEVNTGAVSGDFTIADTNACFDAPIIVNWVNHFGADTIQVSTDNVSFADADSVVENGTEFNVFLTPGTYYLRGRLDAGSGCTDVTNSIEVIVNAEMQKPDVDFIGSNEACQGNDVVIEVKNYTDNIMWNNDPLLTDNPLMVSKTSSYVATVTDPVTGCTVESDKIDVVINVTPPKPILSCDGNALGTDMAVITYEWYKNGIVLSQFTGSVIEYDKDGGFYNAIAVSDKGCKSLLSDTVFMPTKANIVYDNVNLTADVLGASYKWYLNGNEIVGETAQTLAHNKVEGTYTVEVFNAEECVSTISDEFVLSTVGVQTNFTSNNVSVFPNPSSSTVHVFVSNAYNEALTITVLDLSGKSVFVSNIASNQINTTIEVTNLDAGMYIVNVYSANQSEQIKLIVK